MLVYFVFAECTDLMLLKIFMLIKVIIMTLGQILVRVQVTQRGIRIRKKWTNRQGISLRRSLE